MELYSEIARLALTDDEKTRLRVRFTENPNIESKAQAVLPTCGNDNLKVDYLRGLLPSTGNDFVTRALGA